MLLIHVGCSDFGDSSGYGITIRPVGMDLNGVKGFVVAENIPATRSGGDVTTTAPYSLYSIDENGNLKLSIFYFELVTDEEENVSEIQKEISNALQIVPSLVTDFGKYILFSECEYQLDESVISNKARSICERYISMNTVENMRFLIRKSDGALFDLSNQKIFSYYTYECGYYGYRLEYCDYVYYPESNSELMGLGIPDVCFTTSEKNNLFIIGGNPVRISKIVDNGSAIDVVQVTQNLGYSLNESTRFAVDKDENVYVNKDFNYSGEYEIYRSDGGFNVINIPYVAFDMRKNDNGDNYVFSSSLKGGDGLSRNGSAVLLCSRLVDGSYEKVIETVFENCYIPPKDDWYNGDFLYLGCIDNVFKWRTSCSWDSDDESRQWTSVVLSFDNNNKEWSLKPTQQRVPKSDIYIEGAKSYGVNINGNNIEVTEVDFVTETSREYTFPFDFSSLVKVSYQKVIMQETPFLIIKGRNTKNGTHVSYTVNLVSGESNSTFESDTRNVVSFYRIN